MKLYFAPGACSLSNRISLHEAGLSFETERVDLRTKTTECGDDFLLLNPKGSVPLLLFNDGQSITENIAVLSLIADYAPQLLPEGSLGRIHMLEMLSFISTELHIAFKPFFHESSEFERISAGARITELLHLVKVKQPGPYLFGRAFTPADAYLFVILLWAKRFSVQIPERLLVLFEHAANRVSVRQSMAEEGLSIPEASGIILRREEPA